jgi:hypothetical protein
MLLCGVIDAEGNLRPHHRSKQRGRFDASRDVEADRAMDSTGIKASSCAQLHVHFAKLKNGSHHNLRFVRAWACIRFGSRQISWAFNAYPD